MKKTLSYLIIIIFLCNIFLPVNASKLNTENDIVEDDLSDISGIAEYDGGYRYNIQGWTYVYVHGDAYERGFQHGILLADEIVQMIYRWSVIINNYDEIRAITSKGSDQLYEKVSIAWWNWCKDKCDEIYWEKYPDEYKQEIIGIADGVNSAGKNLYGSPITYKDVLASNEMYEFLSKITQLKKGFHPVRTLFGELKRVISDLSDRSELLFILDFISQPPVHHCSGFIATGDATTEGQIVATDSMWCGRGSWWWTYYISLRWNIILDINPTNGNRVVMSSAPGFIWSDHDYYQNDNGIVLIETTLDQGLWDNRGLPLAVRARNAMQYGNSIDDVIDYLVKKSDGSMNAVWLIGDTKTGEIARLDLGLYQYGVYRTYDGFYWSANNPMDLGVRLEKFKLFKALYHIIRLYTKNSDGYVYYLPQYRPGRRDIKFEELGNEFYGKMDVDVVKQIMMTRPISGSSTDCKLSDSYMIDNNGLWAFFGKITGKTLLVDNYDTKDISVENVPPHGWVRMYGIPEEKDLEVLYEPYEPVDSPDVIWSYDTVEPLNYFEMKGLTFDDKVFYATTQGYGHILDIDSGELLYNLSLGGNTTEPSIWEEKVFVGTDEGLKIVDLNWMLVGEKSIGRISSKPVVLNDRVYVGTKTGDIYCFDVVTGNEIWKVNLGDEIYISDHEGNEIFVTTGCNCYCLNSTNGDIFWTFETNGFISSNPYVCENSVFFGSWDNFLYSIDKDTGVLLWKFETGWGIDTAPVVNDSIVYFGSNDHNFYALGSEDGSLVWKYSCFASVQSSPSIVKGFVVFGSDDGRLYGLDKSDGEKIWEFSPKYRIDNHPNYATTPIRSNPVVFEDSVLIGIHGLIYRLEV